MSSANIVQSINARKCNDHSSNEVSFHVYVGAFLPFLLAFHQEKTALGKLQKVLYYFEYRKNCLEHQQSIQITKSLENHDVE